MDQFLKTPSGQRLHLVFLPGRRQATGALIIHGRGDSTRGPIPQFLRQTCQFLGLPVVLVDLPGHGKSSRTFADFVYTQTVRDLEAVVAWMREQGMVRIAVLGHSLGGALAVSLAARSKHIGNVIALAPPPHLRERFLARYAPLQLTQLSRRGYAEYVRTNGSVGRQNKTFFDDLSNVDLFRDARLIRVPTLIVHGTADLHNTIEEERALTAAIGGEHRSLKVLPGCGHDFLPPYAWQTQRLVEQHLRRFFIPPFSPVVNVFVQRADGRLLFVLRNREMFYYGGYWHVVAGFLDKGNSPRRQALEELRQEVGLNAKDVRFVKQGKPFILPDPEHARTWRVHPVLYRLHGNPQLRLNWESEKFAWFRVPGLKKRKTIPQLPQSLQRLDLV